MAKLTWLGPDDYGEGESPPNSLTWVGIDFPRGVAVEVDEVLHPVMVQKARGNRMFKVDDGPADAPVPASFVGPHSPQWREPATEADPADVSFFDDPPGVETPLDFPPDYPPEEEPKRKPGRPRKVTADGNS